MRNDTVWDRPSWPLKGNPKSVIDQLNEFFNEDSIVLDEDKINNNFYKNKFIDEKLTNEQNNALKMLKSKLYEIEIQKIESDRKEVEGEKSEIGWGSQIRSYVLHPYRMVKDLRSNYEDSDPDSVLDGNIDKLIFSNLIS